MKMLINNFLVKWKINWYTFWRNWHYVKYYYYNSARHLYKTKKFRRKLKALLNIRKDN